MTNYRPRLIYWIIAAILILLTAVPTAAAEKVTICHVPPGNPENAHTITIGAPAARAHLANHDGDYEGECQPSTTISSPSPSPTPSQTSETLPGPTSTKPAIPSLPDTAMPLTGSTD